MIVQTWSFTARSQTIYEGRARERILPVAFLEYGSGVELARDSDRHLWFLSDPVEDRPNQGWDQYRAGYERTLVASLLWPEVGAYEAMPWPGRVFTGRYPRGANARADPAGVRYRPAHGGQRAASDPGGAAGVGLRHTGRGGGDLRLDDVPARRPAGRRRTTLLVLWAGAACAAGRDAGAPHRPGERPELPLSWGAPGATCWVCCC